MRVLVDTFGSKIWGDLSPNPCLDFNGKYAKPGWSGSIGPIVLSTIYTPTFIPKDGIQKLGNLSNFGAVRHSKTFLAPVKRDFF